MAAAAKVEGVRGTIKELRDVDAKLARQAIADIKRPAMPAAAAVRSAAPAAPLSRMGGYGGTKAGVRYGGRGRSGEWPLVRIQLRAPGWTVASDMARRSSPGESMVANLNTKWGSPSRWVWPTVEARVPGMIAAIKEAVRKVERQVNGSMERVR